MYSNKKNILQLVSLLKAYGINRIVLSPGSRNTPIIQTISQCPFFECHSVVDERSAAFVALGMALYDLKPVAICCTSGSALLNYGSAVSEAFYQKIPLVVISADRPEAWIGQMAGQTFPQPGVFRSLVKKSVQLPQIHSAEDEWHCNRLINEALIETTRHGSGPVHINVPISEPLFDFETDALPQVRKIEYLDTSRHGECFTDQLSSICETLHSGKQKCMFLIGQSHSSCHYESVLQEVAKNQLILSEHIGNTGIKNIICNFDEILYILPDSQKQHYAPDLLITVGGHLVSKRIKKFIKAFPPKQHWHITMDNDIPDTYQALTHVVQEQPSTFFKQLSDVMKCCPAQMSPYVALWKKQSHCIDAQREHFVKHIPYSDLSIMHLFFSCLPAKSAVHLGNSSIVRKAQLFSLPFPQPIVCCNRGISGIDGVMSTAIGYATQYEGLSFLLIGDLSFFYDINSLWIKNIRKTLRILLFNNGGGEIFHLLPGLKVTETVDNYISCRHQSHAREWAESIGFEYLEASDETELTKNMQLFTRETSERPVLFEVFTSMEVNTAIFKSYFHTIKNQSYE